MFQQQITNIKITCCNQCHACIGKQARQIAKSKNHGKHCILFTNALVFYLCQSSVFLWFKRNIGNGTGKPGLTKNIYEKNRESYNIVLVRQHFYHYCLVLGWFSSVVNGFLFNNSISYLNIRKTTRLLTLLEILQGFHTFLLLFI